MKGVGSFFIIGCLTAADISFCSMFTVEKELLYGSNVVFEIASKLPDSLLQMLGVRYDIVMMTERARGVVLTTAQIVDHRGRLSY